MAAFERKYERCAIPPFSRSQKQKKTINMKAVE